MPISLSVLDQSPISAGSDASTALANSVELVQLAERLGYRRYWVAEHHATSGLAGSAPEILIAHLAARTSTIRVGSGGVMLPHYSPFKVAEQFRVLEALYPGRIDLGVGRAPGGGQLSAVALQRNREQPVIDDFPRQIVELFTWLGDSFPDRHPFSKITATPVTAGEPAPWVLSSSGYGAAVAAQLGTGFCFADFINPEGGAGAVAHYLATYAPSRFMAAPQASVAVSVICARSDEEAERLAAPLGLWRRRLHWGDPGRIPSVEDALAELAAGDKPELSPRRRRLVLGAPDRVADELKALAGAYGVEEIVVVTITHDHADRLRSYELLADAFGLDGPEPG